MSERCLLPVTSYQFSAISEIDKMRQKVSDHEAAGSAALLVERLTQVDRGAYAQSFIEHSFTSFLLLAAFGRGVAALDMKSSGRAWCHANPARPQPGRLTPMIPFRLSRPRFAALSV